MEFTADDPTSADAVWKSFNFLVDDITDENKRISKSFSSAYVLPNTRYSLRVFTNGRSQGVVSNMIFFETSTGGSPFCISFYSLFSVRYANKAFNRKIRTNFL